ERTVAARLARARERLRKRLTHRGLAISAAALAAWLSESAASGGRADGCRAPGCADVYAGQGGRDRSAFGTGGRVGRGSVEDHVLDQAQAYNDFGAGGRSARQRGRGLAPLPDPGRRAEFRE